MTLEAQVLGDKAVRAADGGYEVDLHLAWYRSLPLSCLCALAVGCGAHAAQRGADDSRRRVGEKLLRLHIASA